MNLSNRYYLSSESVQGRPAPQILPIRIYGDETLRKKCRPVEKIDKEIRNFAADLVATMYEKDGVGLAAPQVGIDLCMFVVDPDWFRTNQKNPTIFINPKFLAISGITSQEEGCLSLPEIFAEVKRAEKIEIEATDLEGNRKRYEIEGFFARAVQHENDHLDGILFIDRISKLKLLSLKWKLKNLEQKTDRSGVNLDTYFTDKENDIHRNS
jgi:peptide deformylase